MKCPQCGSKDTGFKMVEKSRREIEKDSCDNIIQNSIFAVSVPGEPHNE